MNTNNGNGVGFCGLLFITFLVLKLTEVIAWSWWWITAPLWGGLAIFLAIMAVAAVIALAVGAIAWCLAKRLAVKVTRAAEAEMAELERSLQDFEDEETR
jgi:hypothetical protein